MNGLTIIPECYVDTCLTETITSCYNKFNHQNIIQISPAIERFFLKAADEKEIDITTYGLPNDLKSLTKMTKQISDKNERAFITFRQLFKDISDASEFQRLAALILYLGDKVYNADVEILREIVNT